MCVRSYPRATRVLALFFTNRREHAYARVGARRKEREVRPGRVGELCVHTNVRGGSHNVVIYCRARHCGRPTRGRCDGSKEEKLVPPRRFSKGSRKRKVFLPFPLFRKRDSFLPSSSTTSFPSLSKIRDRVFLICLLFIRLFIAAKIPRRGREDTRDFVVRNYRWLAGRYFDAGAKLVAALLTTLRVIERGRGGEGGDPRSAFLRTCGVRVIGERANRNGRIAEPHPRLWRGKNGGEGVGHREGGGQRGVIPSC